MSGRDDLAKENVLWHAATLLWDSGKEVDGKSSAGKGLQIQNTNQLNTKYNIRNTNTIYENTSKIKIQSTLRKKLMAKAVLGKAFKATGVSVGCGTAEITTSMIFLPAEYWRDNIWRKKTLIASHRVLRNTSSQVCLLWGASLWGGVGGGSPPCHTCNLSLTKSLRRLRWWRNLFGV